MKKLVLTILVSILAVASVSARQFPNKRIGDICGNGNAIYNWLRSDKADIIPLIENSKVIEENQNVCKAFRDILNESDFKDLAAKKWTGVEIEYTAMCVDYNEETKERTFAMFAIVTQFNNGKITWQNAYRGDNL
jgi:hypothetical protein